MTGDNRGAEFDDFVLSRSPALQRAAFLMVSDISLAQDLVQEALAKTYVAWPRLRRTASAEAYTRKAITTTAISWFRRKSWNNERVVATMPEHLSGGHDDAVVQKTMLWTCLQELPPRHAQRSCCATTRTSPKARPRTSVGFVLADGSDSVYSVVGTEVTDVGCTDPAAIRLVSDADDPVAAWVDAEQPRSSPSIRATTPCRPVARRDETRCSPIRTMRSPGQAGDLSRT